jgi:catalase (peroxidase I)
MICVGLTILICAFAAGLQAAIDLIEPIKAKYPAVSYADLYQMASAVAVEVREWFTVAQ